MYRYKDLLMVFFKSRAGKGLNFNVLEDTDFPCSEQLSSNSAFQRVINLDDISRSMRFNPIQLRYLPTLQDTIIYSERLINAYYDSISVNRNVWESRYMNIVRKGSSHLLAASLWFMMNYDKRPYDANGKELVAEYSEDFVSGTKHLTGRVFDEDKNEVMPAYWLGKYSDMPHVLALLSLPKEEWIEILCCESSINSLLKSTLSEFNWKCAEDFVFNHHIVFDMVGDLCTPEFFWVFGGNDFHVTSDVDNYLLLVTPDSYHYMSTLSAFLGCPVVDSGEKNINSMGDDAFDIWNHTYHKHFYLFYGHGVAMNDYLYDYYRSVFRDIEDLKNDLNLNNLSLRHKK